MRIAMPSCFDDGYLEELAAINASGPAFPIGEVYGSIPSGPVGSGRSPAFLPPVSREDIERHALKAKSVGLGFNYVLNASCTGGAEHDPVRRTALLDHVAWVASLSPDAITVGNPFLARHLALEYPHIPLCLSAVSDIRRPRQLSMAGGFSRVVASPSVNRDLEAARAMVATGTEVELLANENCLPDCPRRRDHYDSLAHAGEVDFVDYHQMACMADRLADPSLLVKSPWIRPEDAGLYAASGISWLKVSGRHLPASDLLVLAGAYSSGNFAGGDLWTLIGGGSLVSGSLNRSIVPPGMSSLADEASKAIGLSIDNDGLSGFVDRFAGDSPPPCRTGCGTACDRCRRWADRTVTMDHEARDILVGELRRLVDGFHRGLIR